MHDGDKQTNKINSHNLGECSLSRTAFESFKINTHTHIRTVYTTIKAKYISRIYSKFAVLSEIVNAILGRSLTRDPV